MQEMLVLLLRPCVIMDISLHRWLSWGTGVLPEKAQSLFSSLLLRLCAFLNDELDSYQNSSQSHYLLKEEVSATQSGEKGGHLIDKKA